MALTDGAAATDTLTVSSAGCGLNFGALNLGATGYTTANVTFGGNGSNKSKIDWSWSTKTLTVTLGRLNGTGPATVASSAMTYTPSTSVLNLNGVPVGGTFVTASGQQF